MSATAHQGELPLDGAAVFPRMRSERAEFYIAQIRQMLQLPMTGSRESAWWNDQMTARDRRFLLRVARLDARFAELAWHEIGPAERVRLVASVTRLREWVLSFHLPLDAYKERAFHA